MNAHKILNVLDLYSKHLNDSESQGYTSDVRDLLVASEKFHFGLIDGVPFPDKVDMRGQRWNLPFPSVYYEFQVDEKGKGSSMGAVCSRVDDLVYVDAFINHLPTMERITFTQESHGDLNLVQHKGELLGKDVSLGDNWQVIVCLCFFVTQLMSCSNVTSVENVPSRLKQNRAKKKKLPPLFTYRTLHIKGKSESKSSGSGTHESPSVHLRRGHIRNLPSGGTTWVQSCVVGNPEKGAVFKDYRVDTSEMAAA